MAIEIQLRTSALIALTRRTLQRTLRTSCLPAGPGFSIDHIDIVDSAISVAQAGAAVEMQVPADVFVVTDADMFAAPNKTPQGATAPAGRTVFPVRLDVQTVDQPIPGGSGTQRRVWLRLVPQPPLFGPHQIPLGPLPTSSVEITKLVEILKVGNLDQVSVVTGDGVVSVRFGGDGAVASRLLPGQDWGAFSSGDAITRMIRGFIEPHLTGALRLVSVNASYGRDGTTPRVHVTARAMLGMFGAQLGAQIKLSSTLQLLTGPAPVLRIAVNWSVDVETSLLVPIFGPIVALVMAPIAEKIATDLISDALDVSSFGATSTGDTSFFLDEALPPLEWGLATLRYDSLIAGDSGMVLGGAVLLAAVASTPFRFTVWQFSGPTRVQLCSILAKSGSGAPSKEPPTLANTRVFASAEFEGTGQFCQLELRSPGAAWLQHVTLPSDGTVAESGTIDVRMYYGTALSMPAAMSFVVRTPRGVRFVDFGQPPPPTFDAQGRLVLVMEGYIPDCNKMVVREKGRFGIGWRWDKEDFKPVPLEWPGWAAHIAQGRGLIVQLVTLSGLDAGEFVRFRSSTHMIHATANVEGTLTLPVLQPLQAVGSPGLLERVNGKSLAGHVSVETAAFEQVAAVPGVLTERVTALPSGGLRLVTRTRQGLMKHSIGAGGMLSSVALNPQPLPPAEDVNVASLNPQPLPPVDDASLVALNPQPLPLMDDGDLAALNPQPLPPVDDWNLAALNPQPLPPVDDGAWPRPDVDRLDLHGVRGVAWVPGFAGRSVALADVGADGHLLLDLTGGRTRVAGTFVGPFGQINTSKHFAFMTAKQQVVVFNRLEAPMPMPAAVPMEGTPPIVS